MVSTLKAFYETRQYDSPIKVWYRVYNDMHIIAHWHSEIEFIFIKDGASEITVGDRSITAKKGDLVVCDSGEIHYSSSTYMDNSLEFLIFDPMIIHNLFDGFHLKNPLLKKETLKNMGLEKELSLLLELTVNEMEYKENFYDEIIAASLKKFCFLLHRKTAHLTEYTKNREYKQKIHKFRELLDFIEDFYNTDLSLDQASERMNLSKSYFSTLFKEYTGSNFVKYVNAIRIEKAVLDLKDKNKSITDIAFTHGFNNIRTFNRIFKEFTGLTPTEFAKKSEDYSDSFPYRIRKSAYIEHTEEFKNKTIVSKTEQDTSK